MEIVFDPVTSKTNQYVLIFTHLLGINGVKAQSLGYYISHIFSKNKVEIVHLNWYENLNGKKKSELFISFLKKTLKLFIIKLLGKKIIWTMHNKLPHDQEANVFNRIMLFYMIYFSSTIIIHSKASEKILLKYDKRLGKKIKYVPHPNYINRYGVLNSSSGQNKDISSVLQLLFIGSIRPYKNIELLLDVIKSFKNDEVMLTIAGKPGDENYKNKITKYASQLSNVNLVLKFIDDNLLPDYIQSSDLLVLPYSMKSSLNSGTVILAFSYARTIICPRIGTISDLKNEDHVLTYTYENEQQHYQSLHKQISKAIIMKRENPLVFKEYGKIMYNYVAHHNDSNVVVKGLLEVYNGLRIKNHFQANLASLSPISQILA